MMARTIFIGLLLLSSGLIAFAPTGSAQAQTITITLDCPSQPSGSAEIRPLSTPGVYSCEARTELSSGSVSDPATVLTVTLDTDGEQGWMNPILSPKALTFTYSEAEGYGSQPFEVSVALDQSAPAFQTTSLTITGTVGTSGDPTGNIRQVVVQDTDLTVTPGYFNLYNVALQKKIGQGGPQESVVYPIQIDNFSNGQTRFEFNLVGEDNLPAGFQPTPPDPMVLQSQATGGEQTSGQRQFEVYTPYQNGYVNEIGSIQLDITSAYALDTQIEGVTSRVSTLTQARGFYVPGIGAPLSALAIAGVALLLARSQVPELE